MLQRRILTLAEATAMAASAVNTCKKMKFSPISVVVVDSFGMQIVAQRMDGCLPSAYPKFALAKALTCVSMQMSSRSFRDKYTASADPAKFCQMLAMTNITGGQLAPFPGGVLLKSIDGQVLGAIGISGASADEDEYCAIKGFQDANLKECISEPPKHCLSS